VLGLQSTLCSVRFFFFFSPGASFEAMEENEHKSKSAVDETTQAMPSAFDRNMVGYWCWDADRGSPREALRVEPPYGGWLSGDALVAERFAISIWRARSEREVRVRVGVLHFDGYSSRTAVYSVVVSSEPAAVSQENGQQMTNVERLISR
jgi:hypothetical protein